MTIIELSTVLRHPLKEEGDCWIFQGPSKNNFHGSVWLDGKSEQAHRIAYRHSISPIPDNKFVLHSCDNGMCVNPNHLFLGTQADNVQDMISKGRHNFSCAGIKNGRATIDIDDVLFIRFLYSNGVNRRQISNEFNLSFNQITRIVTGQAWSHI